MSLSKDERELSVYYTYLLFTVKYVIFLITANIVR